MHLVCAEVYLIYSSVTAHTPHVDWIFSLWMSMITASCYEMSWKLEIRHWCHLHSPAMVLHRRKRHPLHPLKRPIVALSKGSREVLTVDTPRSVGVDPLRIRSWTADDVCLECWHYIIFIYLYLFIYIYLFIFIYIYIYIQSIQTFL